MANRLSNPNQQFCDTTGAPYAGGSLTFYASGTTTPLNTYSDRALTIANTNPVVLDSAGRSGSIFLQNLAYKVVLEDVNNVVIWTMDPVYASDFSTVAQFQSGSGSPNGSVAGQQGSATIPASSYWDFTNQILYICTQTGTTSTAVWTAINSGSTVTSTPTPDGYLTPVSGTPIITSDALSVTSVYYTPYTGNMIPIYNGTTFVTALFSELSLSMSSLAANGIYDVFVFLNSGVVSICSGPAWTSAAAGSGSRGSGAGTTQLTRVNGILVNAVSMTGKNGSTSFTIPANQATYVGSLFIDGTNGQVTCHRSYGQSRKWGVWNAFNRTPIILQAGDPTASWTESHGTLVITNSNAANSLTTFCGLSEEEITLTYDQVADVNNSGSYIVGIGWNVTNAISGLNAKAGNAASGAATSTIHALYEPPPALGINLVTALNQNLTANSTVHGTVSGMILSASWRA